MPPVAVIEPSTIWHRRAALFSGIVLAIVLVGGIKIPLILILAPFVGYAFVHSLRLLQPGRVGIELHEEHIVAKFAFRAPLQLERSRVLQFLPVYRGENQVVVARVDEVDPRGADGQRLIYKTDLKMPVGLMRNPGLVKRLEAWRSESFSTDSLIPGSQKS